MIILLEAAAATFTLARLLRFRLMERFPALAGYLAAAALQSFILSAFPTRSHPYFWVYLIGNPFVYLLAASSVRELFSLIFRDYPGVRTAGRWTLYFSVAISLVASALVLRDVAPQISAHSEWLYYEQVIERSLTFALALIIVTLLAVLSRYPLRLNRNDLVASVFFSANLLVQAMVNLVDTFSPRYIERYVDFPAVIVSALLFTGWGIALRPAKSAIRSRQVSGDPREDELLRQLHSLNDILSRSVSS